MTVREYIESFKHQLIGYKLIFEDYNEYKLFDIKLDKDTDLDDIKDPLEQKLLDNELVGIHGDPDDSEKQAIFTSRCFVKD